MASAAESESKSALKAVNDDEEKEKEEEEGRIRAEEKIFTEVEAAIRNTHDFIMGPYYKIKAKREADKKCSAAPSPRIEPKPDDAEPEKVEEKPQQEIQGDCAKAGEKRFDFENIQAVQFQRNVSSNPPEGPLDDIQIIVSDSEEPIANCVWPPVKTEVEKILYPSTHRYLKSLYQTEYRNFFAEKTPEQIKLYRSPLAIDSSRPVCIVEPVKYLPTKPVQINGRQIHTGPLTLEPKNLHLCRQKNL